MFDLLDLFRVRLGGRPLLLSIVILTLLLIRWRTRASGGSTGRRMTAVARSVFACGMVGLLAYPTVAVWYALDWHFFDLAEPTIPAVGWLFHAGEPLYHAADSAQRYALIYGPMAFIAHGVALALFGPHIEVSKGLGAAAGILSLVFLYLAIRRDHPVIASASLTGICALLLLAFRHYSFWTRPDSLQLACVSAGLLCAVAGRGYGAAVLAGLMSGILWNLKFTGPLYTLPVFVLLLQRTGLGGTIAALAVAGVAAVLPFASLSNVSFTNYLTWVDLSARTGLDLSVLRQNIEWAGYLSLPLLLSHFARSEERRPVGRDMPFLVIMLLVGMCGVVLAAAKPGAGPYHLMPFLPVILYVVARQTQDYQVVETRDPFVPLAAMAFLAVAGAIVLAQQTQFITTMLERRTGHEAADIRQFADTRRGIIEMGYGQNEVLSLARPILVFRNGSYLLDQPAIREHQLAGLEVPRATIDALVHCRVNYWLVPKGELPFSGINTYPSVFPRALYSDEFRRAFAATHQLVDTTAYYDVWQCHSTPAR